MKYTRMSIKRIVIGLAIFATSCHSLGAFAAINLIRLKTGVIGSDAVSANVSSAATNGQSLWLVQWKGNVHESEKRQLEGIGSTILRYVPDNTFLVKLSSANASEQLASFSFVERVLPYQLNFKIEPGLSGIGIFSADERIRVSVVTTTDADLVALQNSSVTQLQAIGRQVYLVETTRSRLSEIAARADVLWVEKYIPVRSFALERSELLDDESGADAAPAELTGYESGTRILNVAPAYAAGIDGTGQLLGFADTGLDKGSETDLHADFIGNLHTARSVGLGGRSWGDPQAHGTHVAGSIAGNGAMSDGGIRGTAFGAKLVAQGMWSDILNNILPPAIDTLFGGAYADGARIHSNSWGREANGRYDAMARDVDQFMFEHQDFLAVFAAGNSGKDLNRDGVIDEGSLGSPATAKNTLTVGASQNFLLEGGIQRPMRELRNGEQNWGVEPIASSLLSQNALGMAAFSSRGPAADGRVKPDVVAPGTNIVSARSRHASAGEGWGAFDEHYLYMGGTSMATPLTSGAMGLLRQHLLAVLGRDSVSAALLKATVINGAFDLYPGQFGERTRGQEQPTVRPNNHEGFGRVDVGAVVAGNRRFTFVDSASGLGTGETADAGEFTLAPGETLRVTLAYTDAPGAASAARAMVNDLDISLRLNDGSTLHPNRLDRPDRVNNVEHIDYVASGSSTVRVMVRGNNVPMGISGRQPYAVVMSVE